MWKNICFEEGLERYMMELFDFLQKTAFQISLSLFLGVEAFFPDFG